MHRLLNRSILEKTEDFYYGLGFLQSHFLYENFIWIYSNLHLFYEGVRMRRIAKIIGFLILIFFIVQVSTASNQMSAQKAINDANAPVEQTDELINYFKVNKGMSEDPRLSSIITKREIAADLVVDARDLASQGRYDEAVQKAGEAYTKANEALDAALELKAQVDNNAVVPTSQRTSPAITSTFDESNVESQQDDIINQLKRQNELLEEQNRKLSEQNNILQNFIDAVKNFLGSLIQSFFSIISGYIAPESSTDMTPNYAGNYIADTPQGIGRLTLNPDNTFYLGDEKIGVSGKYSVCENVITLTPNDALSYGLSIQVTVSGNTLIMTNKNGQNLVFRKQS